MEDLDFEEELGFSFFVQPAETRDTFRRVKRAADALASDFAAYEMQLSAATREAFARWHADFSAAYDAAMGQSWWQWGASDQDVAERHLAEASDWRRRFELEARAPASGPDPADASTLPEQGVPGGISEIATPLKWGAAVLGLVMALKIYQDWR